MKKILAVLLAAAMVVAMAGIATAEEAPAEYTQQKVFDGTYGFGDAEITVKTNDDMSAFDITFVCFDEDQELIGTITNGICMVSYDETGFVAGDCQQIWDDACASENAWEPIDGAAAEEAAPAEDAAAEEAAPAGDLVEIKLASHNAVVEGNPYRVRYELDIQEAAADAANYGYDVSYNSFVANSDASTEQQQLTNSINEGYDIIINDPVATTGLDPIIEEAQDAGIIYINADCAYMSTDVDILNVVTDQEYLGYKTGSYAGEVLGEGAKVVMIAALEGNQANTDRQRGFEKAIEEYGLEVVATGNHDWDTTKSQQIMAEILNQGIEFDGVLVSQCAENALEAFDAAGVAYPGFIGFGDTGAFMQKMLEVNAEEVVTPYIVLSNPPGVGATALNFALNEYAGNTLKEGVYAEGYEDTHQIWIKSKVCYTDQDVTNGVEIEGMSIEDYANSFEAGDSITFWLTFAEVKDTYFE